MRPEHVTRTPTNGSKVLLSRDTDIYTFWYNFETVLYQFLETGTSDRTLTGLDQLLRSSGFIFNPLLFFLSSPFSLEFLNL